MSGTIKPKGDHSQQVKCHLMPLTIDYEGPASVSSFFETTFIKSPGSETIEASLRGRPLKGKQVQLPRDYFGAIIKREEDDCISIAGGFEQLYYWKYDEEPSELDPLPRSLDWFAISSALHESSE